MRDHGRELRDLEHDLARHVEKYEPIVDRMLDQDKLAEMMRAATADARTAAQAQTRLRLSWWQVAIAAIVGCSTLVTSIIVAVGH